MGDVLQDEAVWPSKLDEQLITELLSDESLLLGSPQPVPGGGGGSEPCTRGTGPPSTAPAPCNSGGGSAAAEHELVQLEAVSRALCSMYSGPTIWDIEKALSSSSTRTYPWSSRRYSPMHLFGAASRAPESKYTTKVRSCAGKAPSDGNKWRKYGQKSIKDHPHPRSYYKCASSRCGAKKHVEKSVDDPDMLIVTYEGPHLHAPQPFFPRRQWASVELSGVSAAKSKASNKPTSSSPTTTTTPPAHDDGGLLPNQAAAGSPPLPPEWQRVEDSALSADSCCDDGCSTASVPAARAAAALRCDSPPTAWSCLDFPFPWSLELESPLL